MLKFSDRTETYVIRRAGNCLRVSVTESNNGQNQMIWYTSLEILKDATWEHVKGSASGHGYGPTGEASARERADKMYHNGWMGFLTPEQTQELLRKGDRLRSLPNPTYGCTGPCCRAPAPKKHDDLCYGPCCR